MSDQNNDDDLNFTPSPVPAQAGREMLSPTHQRLTDAQDKVRSELELYKQMYHTQAAKNDELIRSMVPAHLAERLKGSDTYIAEGHADVSVFFVDIVNFTRISGDLTPHGVVKLLDGFFTPLDELCEKYHLEKIKTIGDAYMLAGGLDPDDTMDYTQRTLRLAFDVLGLAKFHEPVEGHPFGVRVGVATGPVVAGVIGLKKMSYDLWGDTVNIAARMCSEAEVNGVAIDDLTYLSVSNLIDCEEPREIDIKGKGKMKVYRVRGFKD